MDAVESLKQPVEFLTGIGLKTAKRLNKIGIFNCHDLLFHLPVRYEDRTRLHPLGELEEGYSVLVTGSIIVTDIIVRRRSTLVCRISDGTGFLTLRFFHFSAQQQHQLTAGKQLSCFGEVRMGFDGLEMIHPEYRVTADPSILIEPCLTPIYPLTEGVSQSLLRKALKQVLFFCEDSNILLKEWLPESVRQDFKLPTLATSLKTLHAPNPALASVTMQTRALPEFKRLAAEELLAHHFSRMQARSKARLASAPVFSDHTKRCLSFTHTLGFTLTRAQQRVIKEITDDCMKESPMMRLIQGDVGCGKTIVSAVAAFWAVSSGYQVGIMAPTELLAEQHFSNFEHWFEPFDIQVNFLSSKIKGQRRTINLTAIKEGSAQIIIGTHALFQTSVEFSRLGLVIIDEQHRFGVNQRLVLKNKGQVGNLKPHQLMMSATPIPRTLAMLRYSDLDISVIDELPPGRKVVTTRALPAQKREQIISRILDWISHRKQAYWVCTLIEESDILQCEAAEKTLATLTTLLPDVNIGLVHGRMKGSEKIQVMADFKQHKIDLLVATTVIEVGVDVPNAGLMVIENSERLGLSQLHQLRGRVGRGQDESFCLLMYQSPLSLVARKRLTILRETNDGFILAEKDLELRGAGDVLGTRQTGDVAFKVADLSLHQDLIEQVPVMAEMINKEAPEGIEPIINRWLSTCVHYAEV